MKKTLFSVGAASLIVAMCATGCASTSQSFDERVKEVQNKVAELRGLEKHEEQPLIHVLANASLNDTRILYISWGAVATDSAVIRFGEADVISVARDASDSSNLKIWDAMRYADADKAKADAAVAEMKKFIAESYAKNKTTSKLSNDEMFETVVGKIAQEDYIAYKAALKDGASESDYKDQKTWLSKGKANVAKAAAEQKKMLEAAEKRLAQAEKDAEANKRKIELVIKYLMKEKIELEVAKAVVAKTGTELKSAAKAADDALKNAEAQCQKASDPFSKAAANTALEIAKKAKQEADKKVDDVINAPANILKELADIKKEFPGVDKVLQVPELKFDASNPDSIKIAKEELGKALAPYTYALEMFGKRFIGVFKAKSLAREAQKALDEVSGE